MNEKKFLKWLDTKIKELRNPLASVVNTDEKLAYMHGAVKSLETIKELIEEGKFI